MKERTAKPLFQLRARLLPVLVGLLLILQSAAPYDGWWVLLVGLGGLWLASYLWTRLLARGLSLECQRPKQEARAGWVHVGARITDRFVLRNDSRLPAPWVELNDQSNLPQPQAGFATSLTAMNAIRLERQFVCARRGLFTLGPAVLNTGDPFGLHTVTIEAGEPVPLMVMPAVLPLPFVEVTPGGHLRISAGRPRPSVDYFTVAAATVREYQPGDSLRWIHWRTSARRDSLFVRLFEDSAPTTSWWIVLDVNRSVQAGAGLEGTEENAVTMAASLTEYGMRAGQAVGLVTHDRHLVWLPPRTGEGQRWEVMRALAQLSTGHLALERMLAWTQSSLGPHESLAVVTPSIDRTWVEALAPLLERGVNVTAFLIAPGSFGGEGDTREVETLLREFGVSFYVITRDLLRSLESGLSRDDAEWQRTSGAPAERPRVRIGSRRPGWRVLL